MIWFVALILTIVQFLSSVTSTQAVPKFNTNYQLTYQVDGSGLTTVEYLIKQKNNLSTVFATEYSLAVNDPTITNIKVFDQDKPVSVSLTRTDKQSIISFKFLNKIVGVDKIHDFTIRYQTQNITTIYGQTWQINLPKLEIDPNISDLIIILEVPPNIPSVSYIDPKPDTQVENRYYFSNKTIFNKSPIALFGQSQVLDTKLTYTLTNKSGKAQTQTITLPPQTNYQQIRIESLDPKPVRVYTDLDQNLLADYSLKPDETLTIKSHIYVTQNFFPQSRLKLDPNKFLSASTIWDFKHSIFDTPELSKLTTAKQLYDYTVSTLNYDYSKISKDGTVIAPASQSLINKHSAICVDFSHLLVALLRKQNIPAREVQGYAITDDPSLKSLALGSNVLHSWVEYFDVETSSWRQIDPTWSKTTNQQDFFNHLDLNRLTLVYHGIDSITPSIVGLNSPESIMISHLSEPPDLPDATVKLGRYYQQGSELVIELINPGGSYLSFDFYNQANSYLDQVLKPINIAPFSQYTFSLPLKNLSFVNSSETNIMSINGQHYEFNFSPKSTFGQIGIYIFGFVVFVVCSIIARNLLFRRRH